MKGSESLRLKYFLYNSREIIKTKRLLFVLLIILIMICSLAFSFFITQSEDASTLSAVISIDKSIARVDEQISFNSDKCKGDIQRFHWIFGDGLESNESNPIHSYETAGWYNVTLNISDNNGNHVNTSQPVGIQQNDETKNVITGRKRSVNPGTIFGDSTFASIGPNIGNPSVDLSLYITNPIGEFEIVINIVIWHSWDDPDDYEIVDIHSETRTATGTDIIFSYSLEPSSIPIDVQNYYSDIWLGIMGQVGRWEYGEIRITTEFPLNLEATM